MWLCRHSWLTFLHLSQEPNLGCHAITAVKKVSLPRYGSIWCGSLKGRRACVYICLRVRVIFLSFSRSSLHGVEAPQLPWLTKDLWRDSYQRYVASVRLNEMLFPGTGLSHERGTDLTLSYQHAEWQEYLHLYST